MAGSGTSTYNTAGETEDDLSTTDFELDSGSGMDESLPGAVVIGASVGGAAFFLLLLCCCVLVMVCVMRRKKKVPLYAAVKKSGPLKGITNAMYTCKLRGYTLNGCEK